MRKLLIFILSTCFCFSAHADIFIVTSSADNGPGTLREAISLANANGTASVDYIHFNIPELIYNDRLIHLETELPALSSNIIIDGTTQPGANYGTTDAKICLIKTDYTPSFSFITIENAESVKVFGLQMYYGYWQGLFGVPGRSNWLYGVNIKNSRQIEIGAPSRGNVIGGVVYNIFSDSENCSEITIRSNYLGQGLFYNSGDEIDGVILISPQGITLANVKNITIGGPQPQDGNIFANQNNAINIDSKESTGNGFILIQNNFLGYQFDKTIVTGNLYDFWDDYVNIGKSRNNPVDWTLGNDVDYKIDLLDNTISANVSFYKVSGLITIFRNTFEYFSGFGGGNGGKLKIFICSKGAVLGNQNESDGNRFLYRKSYEDARSVFVGGSGPVTIGKNVFDCNSVLGSTTSIGYNNNYSPFVQIDITTPNSVEGRAEPDAKVDIYYDDECSACEGKKFLGTTTSDATGNWKYVGPVMGTVVAITTDKDGYSGQFSQPMSDNSKVRVIQPSCGNSNGSVTGITTEGAETFFWIKQATKDTVSKTLELSNAGAGFYILYGVHGGTCVNYLYSLELTDQTPLINTDGISINQPSCGLANGSISGITVFNGYQSKYGWVNSQGDTIGRASWINSLFEGNYTFVVTDTISGCTRTKDFTLKNQSGPSLNMAAIHIVSATCGNSNGSIGGIVPVNVTGNPFIQWVDSVNNIVSTETNLVNVSAGKYRLKFKDETGCDTIITPYYTIADKGMIRIDTSDKLITPASCTAPTGSIEKIKISGADTFQWIDVSDNSVVGSQADVYNLPAGNYRLQLSNAMFCEAQSSVVNIPQETFSKIEVTSISVKDAFCGSANGNITINSFDKSSSGYSFYWKDSATAAVLGHQMNMDNLREGGYLLFAKDKNGCESKITSVHIQQHGVPTFDYSALKITGDQCDLQKGQIGGLVVDGLIGPSSYTWRNEYNEEAGNTILLSGAGTGTYTLHITDVGNCQVQSKPLTLTNINVALDLPRYDDIVILRNANADLRVKNYSAGDYRLYSDAAGTQLLEKNDQGNFTVLRIANDTSFYVRKFSGSCESPLVKINIKVTDRLFYIPNAFSPNGDGLNDIFRVAYPLPSSSFRLSIYNRFGQKVFETFDIRKGWDGTFRGELQPAGLYAWAIQITEIGKEPHSEKGTVTMLR